MSQIDLKFAVIELRDGYVSPGGASGAVNHVGGYAIASTTMLVDLFTGIVAIGDSFKLAGDSTIYTISAHAETSSLTTSITFSPGLVVAVLDDAVITMLPHILEINIGEGTATYDEKQKRQYTLNRGRIDEVRDGDEEPMDVKLEFVWEFLRAASSDTVPTPEEAFKKIGKASTWITSDPDTCRPYSVDIYIIYTPSCAGVKNEQIILPYFRHESLNHELKAGTVAVTGKCNATQAIVTRDA